MTTSISPTPTPIASRPHALPGILAGLVAAATFGSSGVVARPLLEAGWTPGAIVLLRIGIPAILLLPIAVWMMRGRWPVLRERAGVVTLFGVFGIAAAQVCYFNAVQYLSIGVALLMEYSGILLVVGWQWLRTRLRPANATLVGAAVAVVGLTMILDVFGNATVSVPGILWGLGAAVGLAVYFVLGARTEDGLPSLVVVSAGMTVGVIVLLAVAAVGLLPIHFEFTAVTLAGAQLSWIVPMLYLSLVTALLAYQFGIAAAKILGSTMASFFGLTEVLFAVLIAWIVLGEQPSGLQLLGGVLVLGGVVLVRLGELGRGRELPGDSATGPRSSIIEATPAG